MRYLSGATWKARGRSCTAAAHWAFRRSGRVGIPNPPEKQSRVLRSRSHPTRGPGPEQRVFYAKWCIRQVYALDFGVNTPRFRTVFALREVAAAERADVEKLAQIRKAEARLVTRAAV